MQAIKAEKKYFNMAMLEKCKTKKDMVVFNPFIDGSMKNVVFMCNQFDQTSFSHASPHS